MNELQQYINDKLLTKTGAINVAIIRRDKFLTSDIYKQILNATEFLNVYKDISIGQRIKAIQDNITELKYCSCGKLSQLFANTCGNKQCKNKAISDCKNIILTTNILESNDDIVNKQHYLELVKNDKVTSTRNEILGYIKNNLTKTNGHLNIERISQLNKISPHIFEKICILTYFCNNHDINLYNRIKFILLDKNELSFCSCGKLNKLSHDINNMFTASCGNPNCYYKRISNANINRPDEIYISMSNKHIEKKKEFNNELLQFLDNLNSYTPIEYSKFRLHILNLYNNNKSDYNVLGPNRTYIQFKDNEQIIKSLIYYTPFIEATADTLNISKRLYYIINDVKDIIKCAHCKTTNIDFISIKRGYRKYCRNCYPLFYNESSGESAVYDFIKSLNISDIIRGSRTIIPPLELDIVIPSKRLAIEYNGNYWHSEKTGTNNNYHLNKTNMCKDIGYQLIHIFEDEWLTQNKIVKARLKARLGLTKYSIYARKCKIKEIDNGIKNRFLEKYHLQGQDISSTRLGLFYKNRLIAVMTFSKRRFDDKDGFELIRYCTIANFNIIGGAGKLLTYFRKLHPNKSIISYADKRWSTGNLYKQLDFTLTHESSPNYYYIHPSNILKRYNRITFQKHKLQYILPIFDPLLSELENMKNNGYFRLYDCGNYVFELK